MPDIQVRPVRPAEHDEAGRITAAAFEEYARAGGEGWARYLECIGDVAGRAARTLVLVAFLDGRMAGTATLELDSHIEPEWSESPAPDDANLRMVGVLPSLRRRGVGRALVEATIAAARSAGRRRMTLETTAEMTAARAMYLSLGFRYIGVLETHSGLCFDTYRLDIQDAAAAAAAAP